MVPLLLPYVARRVCSAAENGRSTAGVEQCRKRRGFAVAVAVVFALTLNCAHAAPLLSEQQARAKAINILKGDPYGRTPAEVSKNIKQIQFVHDGNTRACGAKKSPAWEFHVVVVTANRDQFNNGVIDGYLALDARTGRILCANLPLLD